ncbi:MAG: Hsp20/alpha crystallin family protein [Lachnospiraceae bacterium]
MLRPSIFGESLFDEFFDFPEFPDFSELEKMENKMNKKLYGRHAKNMMKVDIKDQDNAYEMDIDLPGFKKEEISAELENGYLTITAAKGLDQDEQEKDTGRYIRRERYAGTCQRSFYVGEGVKQEDIKAGFKHGVLKLLIPKEAPKLEQKNDRYIAIEG